MTFCASCGQSMQGDARFCSSCGQNVSSENSGAVAMPAAIPTPQQPCVTGVVIKKAGRMAFRAFALAFIATVAIVIALAAGSKVVAIGADSEGKYVAFTMTICFGIASAYVSATWKGWEKKREILVKGKAFGLFWTALLVLVFLGGVTNLFTDGSTRQVSSSMTPVPVNPKQVLLNTVQLDFNWHTDGFGTVMIADFTIKNPTAYRFKDIEITCNYFGPSGTIIDSNTRTIYQIVQPKSTKVIREQNMGFINSQASSSSCKLTNLTVL